MKLFCFPYAGGVSAMIYSQWKNKIEDVEIIPIEIPGRFSKEGTNHHSICELVHQIKNDMGEEFSGDYAFWGHSLGAIIAFELAREMKASNPKMVFLSGTKPVHLRNHDEPIHTYDDDAFIQEIYAMNGTQKGALDNEEIRNVFLPMLRHDFKLVYEYAYHPSDGLLNIPIVSMVGDQEEVTVEEQNSWRQLTTKGVETHVLSGDHFFLFDHIDDIGEIINRGINNESIYDEASNIHDR